MIIVLSGVLILGAFAALYITRHICLMLIIGLGLGVVLRPGIDWLRSRGKAGEKLAIPIALVGLLGTLAGLLELLYALIADQIIPLSNKMPQYLHVLEGRLATLSSRYHFLPQRLGPENFGTNAGNAAQTALLAVTSSAAFAGDLFFILAVCLYFASDSQGYFDGFLTLFPAHTRSNVAEVMKKSAKAVRQWFSSQLIAMLIVGSILAVALSLLGHPYGYLLGILTGFLEMIPFLGPIAAFGVGVLITLSALPEKLVPVLVIYFVLLQLEGNLIIPLLMKGRIKLPPIYLLTIMLVFASWFGIPGLLVATPVLTVMRTVYLNVLVPRMNKSVRPAYMEPIQGSVQNPVQNTAQNSMHQNPMQNPVQMPVQMPVATKETPSSSLQKNSS